jgi:hypothetical protein
MTASIHRGSAATPGLEKSSVVELSQDRHCSASSVKSSNKGPEAELHWTKTLFVAGKWRFTAEAVGIK